METLQENEKGKLKGGFTSLSGLVAEAAPLMNNCKKFMSKRMCFCRSLTENLYGWFLNQSYFQTPN